MSQWRQKQLLKKFTLFTKRYAYTSSIDRKCRKNFFLEHFSLFYLTIL
jgi:hypothetical protein